jgi:hypothetical protein
MLIKSDSFEPKKLGKASDALKEREKKLRSTLDEDIFSPYRDRKRKPGFLKRYLKLLGTLFGWPDRVVK